jgi:iron complex transport system permease protein
MKPFVAPPFFKRSLSQLQIFLLIVFGLCFLNLLVLILELGMGDFPITPGEVVHTLLGQESTQHEFIVYTLRLPRTIIACLVGSMLAVSGALLQGVIRNPLASPGIIGLNAGAGLGAVMIIVVYSQLSLNWLPLAAFMGALVFGGITYGLAWKGGLSPIRLVMTGFGISAIGHALISIVLTSGHIRLVNQAGIWMAGSLYGRSWEHFWPLLPWAIILLPVALLLASQINVINLGDAIAAGLGLRIELTRLLILIVAVGLASSAVSVGGTIGFVGLIAPHMARSLVGPMYQRMLPIAALMGSLIVMTSDLLGRTLLPPIEIPVGVITAIVGTPFFAFLLYKQKSS